MRGNILLKGVVLFCLFWLCLFALYFGTLPLTKLSPYWGRMGYFDWPIFIEAAQSFLETRILYYADLELYGPSAAVYKFPPFFASVLIVCLRAGVDPETLRFVTGCLQLVLYFTSIWLCLRAAQAKNAWALWISLFLLVATFEPFIDTFLGLQLETYLLFLLSLSLFALVKDRSLLAGACIGMAIALKLYPIFFVSLLMFSNSRKQFLAGLALGWGIPSLFALAVIDYSQNVLYYSSIAPVLAAEELSISRVNVSLANVLHHLGFSEIRWAGPCLLLASTLAALRIARNSHTPLNIIAATAFLVAALLLGMKNSWGNYQLMLLLPIVTLLALALQNKLLSIYSAAALYLAGALIFFSPPHRMIFISSFLMDVEPYPWGDIYLYMRALAGLIILGISVRLIYLVNLAVEKPRPTT